MNKTFFTTALCLASYAAALNLDSESQASAALEVSGPDFFAKAGIICGGCDDAQLDPLSGIANAVYHYAITTANMNQDTYMNTAWYNARNTEFVAMLPRTSVFLQDGSLCTMLDPPVDKLNGKKITTACTVDMLVSTLANTQTEITAPIQYLMTFNEAWAGPYEISAKSGVDMWRNVIQPTAVQANLSLVAPTSKKSNLANKWTADFLVGCYALRDDDVAPCDINLIEKFAIHDYHCSSDYWETNYNSVNGLFYSNLLENINAQVTDDSMDWESYVYGMPLWVTENSCSGDNNAEQDPVQYCQRLTQQSDSSYGIGSINWFNQATNVERWNWYTGFTSKTKGANATVRMVDENGAMLPPGRAIMSQNDPTTDCAAMPVA